MRGEDREQAKLFSYVSPEQRVPADHPLRTIRRLANRALRALSRRFDRLYARSSRFRPSSCCGRCCSRRCTPCAASGS